MRRQPRRLIEPERHNPEELNMKLDDQAAVVEAGVGPRIQYPQTMDGVTSRDGHP